MTALFLPVWRPRGAALRPQLVQEVCALELEQSADTSKAMCLPFKDVSDPINEKMECPVCFKMFEKAEFPESTELKKIADKKRGCDNKDEAKEPEIVMCSFLQRVLRQYSQAETKSWTSATGSASVAAKVESHSLFRRDWLQRGTQLEELRQTPPSE